MARYTTAFFVALVAMITFWAPANAQPTSAHTPYSPVNTKGAPDLSSIIIHTVAEVLDRKSPAGFFSIEVWRGEEYQRVCVAETTQSYFGFSSQGKENEGEIEGNRIVACGNGWKKSTAKPCLDISHTAPAHVTLAPTSRTDTSRVTRQRPIVKNITNVYYGTARRSTPISTEQPDQGWSTGEKVLAGVGATALAVGSYFGLKALFRGNDDGSSRKIIDERVGGGNTHP